MSARTLLMVGAGTEQVLAIREAQKLGLRVVACDGNPDAVGFSEADEAVAVDIADAGQLVRVGREHRVSAIFSHAVDLPFALALAAEELSLPALRPEVARRASDKFERNRRLREAGVGCAESVLVSSRDALADGAARVGFPLVMKPLDRSGARGVSRVDEPSRLDVAWDHAMRHTRVQRVVLEELLTGPEISTETVVAPSGMVHFAFADRNYSRLDEFYPHFVEDGIDFPTRLPAIERQAVLDVVERAIATLEIDFGAAKGDVIVHDGVPKIIEMAPRTSGGWFGAGSIPLATGVNPFPPLFQLALGDEPDLSPLEPRFELGCAQRYLIPTRGGRLVGARGVEGVSGMPGVRMSEFWIPEPGTTIARAAHHADRLGHVICTADTREEAMTLCERAIAAVRLEVEAS